jgi:hypothetical protein
LKQNGFQSRQSQSSNVFPPDVGTTSCKLAQARSLALSKLTGGFGHRFLNAKIGLLLRQALTPSSVSMHHWQPIQPAPEFNV